MQFELTGGQQLLQSSVVDWLEANVGLARPRSVDPAAGEDRWQSFADMGWLGLPFAEADGGFGGGCIEVGLLMHAFGAHLVPEPYAASILVAARLLADLGTDAQRNQLLPRVMDGSARLALAHSEAGTGWPWARRRVQAREAPGGWILSGEKRLVEAGHGPTHWLVSASCEDDRQRLFLVAGTPKVERLGYRTLQGGRACDLTFSGLHIPADAVLGDKGMDHGGALGDALALGLIAQCWGAAGVLEMLVRQTATYVSQRKQFGRALSDFQVVQHKLAEMGVESMDARAACELASMRSEGRQDLVLLASTAKVRTARAATVVGQHAIQLHGAMGVCDELPVAPAYRWLEAFHAQWGRAGIHAAMLGARQIQGGRYGQSAVLEVVS